MDIRSKANRLRANAEVAVVRSTAPVRKFIKDQKDEHQRAVDAKCDELERNKETSTPIERFENLKFISSQEFLDSVKKMLK